MKITFLIAGTRGDIQPFVALALALGRRGHDVCVAAPQDFAGMVAASGARHFPLAVDYEGLFHSDAGRRCIHEGSMVKLMQLLADFDRRVRPQLHRELLASCEGAEALLSNLVLENSAASIAEKLKLPLLLTYMLPLLPTAELPSLMLPQLRLRALNRFTHTVFEALYWQSQKAQTNAWRAELGLPPANGAPRHQLWRMGAPILHAYSSAVVPRPADWSPQNILTGFWVMPQEDGLRACGAPTPELERWLAAGSAPIYLGYWRLPMLDVGAMLRLATQVAQTLGVRFVICAGRNAPDLAGLPVPDSIFVAESVDHGWLFPRCSATFHHGGAGTTAASLRAGLPMVISPLYADQPFWARRAEALGVGCTVPFQTLTAARLAQALRQVQDDAVRARARQLGAILQQEDGVAAAVRLIEERLPTAPILGR